MEMIAAAALVIVLGHLALGVVLWLRVRKLSSYPGLLGSPVFGNLYYFYKSLTLFSIDSITKNSPPVKKGCGKNGLHFQWLNGTVAAVVSSPEILKRLSSNPNLVDKPHLMYGGSMPFVAGPISCLCSDDIWKQKRKEYNTFLKKSLVYKDYYDTFIKCADNLVDILKSPSNLEENVASFTYYVVAKTLFGIETSLPNDPKTLSLSTKVNKWGSIVMASATLWTLSAFLRPLEVFMWKFSALKKEMLGSISNQSSLSGMTLAMQIASRNKKNNESEIKLIQELLEILLTAGHTTSTLISNSIIILAVLPDIQERVWQEQYEIFGEDKRDPTIDDLERMHFLDRNREMIAEATLVIVLCHLALGVVLWLRVRKLYSYPGILGFPVFGNLYYFYKSLMIFTIDSMLKNVLTGMKECGTNGLHFQWLNGNAIVVVSSSDIIKKLSSNPNLADKPQLIYGGGASVLKGPFTSLYSDDTWKQKRKEYNAFLKNSWVYKDYYDSFIKCSYNLVDMILTSPSNLAENVDSFTYHVVGKTLFGYESSLPYDPKNISLATKVNIVATITLANPTLSKVLFALIRPLELLLWRVPVLKKEMLESLSNQCSPSGITLPMQIASRNKKNKESEIKLFQELLEIILTAGHTTSTLLWNSLIILAVLPDIQERVWQEQYEIFGEDNRDPTIDDLERMQFLDRFIKESLRFLAPPLIPKAATADIILDGITIPRGFGVFYILECIRMDPNHFKCPNVFDPDRFLEEDDSLKYTYIPFGIGIRNCPGKYFATTLTKIAISKVIRRIKLKPVDKNFRFEDLKYKSYLLKDIDNPPEILVEDRK